MKYFLFTIACLCGIGSFAKYEEPAILAHLVIEAHRASDGGAPSVVAKLDFENTTDHAIAIPNYLIGDRKEPSNSFFKILTGRKKIDYVGVMAKRAAPSKKDMTNLESHDHASGAFDLSNSYKWNGEKALYSFVYDTSIAAGKSTLKLQSDEVEVEF